MADQTVARGTMYINQGSALEYVVALVDADTGDIPDTTGWGARCEVRQDIGGALIAQFHSDRSGHASWPGVAYFDGSANLWLTLTDAQTALLNTFSNGFFDIELLDPSGVAHRIVEGRAHVTPEVTTDV